MASQTLMTENDVWNMIDSVRKIENKDVKKMRFLLHESLISKSDTTIVSFDVVINNLHQKAQLWDFVAIDKIFSNNRMMSEDAHFYFQFGLISLGKEAYYNVLQNSGKLLNYIPNEMCENGKEFDFSNLDFIGGSGLRIFNEKYGDNRLYDTIMTKITQMGIEPSPPDVYQGYKAKSLKELENRIPNIWSKFSDFRNNKELFLFWFED